MFSPDQAWQTILTHAQQLAAVNVPLSAALNRTLRTPICAETDAPPFDAAAMDGYALQQNSRSAPLRVIGTSQAGIRPFRMFPPVNSKPYLPGHAHRSP